MGVKRGVEGAALPPLRQRRVTSVVERPEADVEVSAARSDVATDVADADAAVLGRPLVKGIPLADYADLLDEKATFAGRWGLRGVRGGPSYDDLVETDGRPRMRKWLDRMQTEGWLDAGVVYGYYPCVSEGNDVVVLNDDGSDRVRFTFPRQRRDRRLVPG